MIQGHLITRAAENVTPVLSVNAICPKQTAPTCFINASGTICKELEKNNEGMLVYDFEKQELNFGELGCKRYSDQLLGFTKFKLEGKKTFHEVEHIHEY